MKAGLPKDPDADSAVVLLGAGSSAALGIPGVTDLSAVVNGLEEPRAAISGQSYWHGGALVAVPPVLVPAMELISAALRAEFPDATFELALHAVEALQSYAAAQSFDIRLAAVRPILSAFTEPSQKWAALINFPMLRALRVALITTIARTIASATASAKTDPSHMPAWNTYQAFFKSLRSRYVLNCFTLNYDTAIESTGLWHEGYKPTKGGESSDFSRARFDQSLRTRMHTLAHLHGSVLFGYRRKSPSLVKFSTSEEAVESYALRDSIKPDVSGELYETGPIISGLRKFDKLNATPYGFYYNAFINAILSCPRLIILGYGFNDPHINYWIAQHRIVHAEKRRVAIVTLEDLLGPKASEKFNILFRNNDTTIRRARKAKHIAQSNELLVVNGRFPVDTKPDEPVVFAHLDKNDKSIKPRTAPRRRFIKGKPI